MVPSAIVVLERLPLTPNGKLDVKALPAAGPPRGATPWVAPRTALEEILARMYADVLAIERVGIDDNFFTELGGHSLLATQLVSRLREAFHVEVALRVVFDHPTVRALAAELAVDGPQRRGLGRTAELLLTVMDASDAELATQLGREPAPMAAR